MAVGRTIKSLSFDAKKEARAKTKQKYKASAAAERDFYRALKKVARASGHIVESHTNGAKITNEAALKKALGDYAELLTPWARRQSEKMLEQVNRSNKRAYANQSKSMNVLLKQQLGTTGRNESFEGALARALMEEQVALIKSIPLEAGQRAQKIAMDNFLNGTRAVPDPSIAKQLEQEMGMSTEAAVNRARLIARTETARANASFVQGRAVSLGVTHYIWRTTMDGAERHSHALMNNKTIAYDKPPTLSDGTTGHAGTFPNCRCWQDPVLPD